MPNQNKKFSVLLAVVVLLGGLVFSIWFGIREQSWCLGIGAAASALYVALWLLLGCSQIQDPVFGGFGVAIGALGMYCIVSMSSAADRDLLAARITVAERLTKAEIFCKGKITPELRFLSEIGPPVCLSQQISDQMALLNDITKAAHLGVAASFVDSIVQSMLAKDVEPCAAVFNRAHQICPALFWKMPGNEFRALAADD